MSEIKLRDVTHKERKDYIKEYRRLNKIEDAEEKYVQLQEFREKFLKEHVEENVDLDALPSKEFDKLITKFEEDIDFFMGAMGLKNSSTVPSSESQATPKQEK